ELAGIYATMARTVHPFQEQRCQYRPEDWRKLAVQPTAPERDRPLQDQAPVMSAGAAYLAFEAMRQVERPNSQGEWERFYSSQKIAWKTGTSFGFRDAWAIGLTPEYAVAVWCGNADMEGRPGLIGIRAAAPILFDLFSLLPGSNWFRAPLDELQPVRICSRSGYRPLPHCPVDTLYLPKRAMDMAPCPYHQLVHLNQEETYQVNQSCAPTGSIRNESWFVLPPTAEYYYKLTHPDYAPLPPFHPDCKIDPDQNPMQVIYPKANLKIYVPKELDGSKSKTIFQVAHRNPNIPVHWHLDEQYLGTTTQFHTLELDPPAGEHILTLVDQNGFRVQQRFEVIVKD
ncbi:MAG: penicillin-binding protein 1C, partial [Phaeodactylibacter sp.]|nr:penicillin-binding protein 1C [Phaeodactylibacter sp.]